jgi:hypothetical protein
MMNFKGYAILTPAGIASVGYPVKAFIASFIWLSVEMGCTLKIQKGTYCWRELVISTSVPSVIVYPLLSPTKAPQSLFTPFSKSFLIIAMNILQAAPHSFGSTGIFVWSNSQSIRYFPIFDSSHLSETILKVK